MLHIQHHIKTIHSG